MTFVINEDAYLKHYGTPRHSGRYPWGSGDNPKQGRRDLLDHIDEMKKQGLSDKEIYQGLGMTSTEYRDRRSIAREERKAAQVAEAVRIRDQGFSNVAVGKQMNPPKNESSVRALLAAAEDERTHIITNTAEVLRQQVAEKQFLDVGSGVANQLGVSTEQLSSAVRLLRDEGYAYHNVQIDQLGTGGGQKTTNKVLAPPGTVYKDIVTQKDKIRGIYGNWSDDGGRSFTGMVPPKQFSSKRLEVKYAEDGGKENDGVIYVRPGVKDVSLGNSRYAQVRIAVDGTHYIKGMAMYKDGLPDGVDLQFNTNKAKSEIGTNKLDALKKIQDDPENPFGTFVRQIKEVKKDGTEVPTSVMNIVNDEGKWETWRKALSSQVLSKQSPVLAKQQLGIAYSRKKEEYDKIMELTNPAVRKKLLDSLADGADSASVQLHAAALPRQQSHVILPINTLRETEIYAPNYNHGERVALIRYPHGGTFEIPELVVNNNHPEGKSLIGRATDAVGINHKVAERLSGADFDGDTVLVIPNPVDKPNLKTQPALRDLKGFDPQRAYPKYPGMKVMDSGTKGAQMGLVSNLITDMTIKGASTAEIARAVKHSMVVIDAEKHELNWKQSAKDQQIPQLMKKYQDRSGGGASTLISRATSPKNVPKRVRRPAKEGGFIDPATGKKVYKDTGEFYDKTTTNPKTGKVKTERVFLTTKSVKLAETEDAHTLVSTTRTKIEQVYADHSNRLKALANQARKESVNTKPLVYDKNAAKVYPNEVQSLNAKLNRAIKKRPLERQAQVMANATVQNKRDANPEMDKAELKKVQGAALMEARRRMNTDKEKFTITEEEWAAIQAGAISNHKLTEILRYADIENVKELATPKQKTLMDTGKTAKAQQLLAAGKTQAEVATILGVSLTTLKTSLRESGG